jgi:pimeloyl-ACP methyl ester carboxylesterase
MGLGPVPVIGHSNSAAVALILAALHPARVSHAILADPIGAIHSPSMWRLVPVHFSVGMIEMEFTALIFSHILYNFIHHWGSLLRQPLFAKLDLTAYAPRVAVPTLLAWGRQDLTTPLYCARRFHSLIPRSHVHVCGGGSHDWIITHPGEFAEAVRRFVGTPKCP